MSFALFNMEESRDRRLRRAYTNENLAPGPAEFGKRTLADPIEGAQPYAARCEGLARPDHDLRMFRIEPHDIKRLAVEADAEPTPLTDRIMDHACVAAEQPAIDMDDIAGNSRLRPNPLDEIAVFARGNKTNVLAIGLVGNDEPMAPGNGARFRLLHLAQRKAQNVELRPRWRRGNSSGRGLCPLPGRARGRWRRPAWRRRNGRWREGRRRDPSPCRRNRR